MATLTKEEREIISAVKVAHEALLVLTSATIDLALAVGDGKAMTRSERAAHSYLRRSAEVIGDVIGSLRDLVGVDRGAKADPELWRIHDANLKREAVLAALRIDHVGDVAFAERPAAKDFESHFVALKAAAWCADDLGVAVPRIRFFSEAGAGEAKAFEAGPGTTGSTIGENEVWVHADLSPREVIRTVAHEMTHLRQIAEGKVGRDLSELVQTYADRPYEAEAYSYGKHVALRLFGKYGHGPADVWREQAREAMARHHN